MPWAGRKGAAMPNVTKAKPIAAKMRSVRIGVISHLQNWIAQSARRQRHRGMALRPSIGSDRASSDHENLSCVIRAYHKCVAETATKPVHDLGNRPLGSTSAAQY